MPQYIASLLVAFALLAGIAPAASQKPIGQAKHVASFKT
jgi:hypothetical protein